MGELIYIFLLCSCFVLLLLIISSICEVAERKIRQRKRAELRAQQHRAAAAEMAEWDKLCQSVIITQIQEADKYDL